MPGVLARGRLVHDCICGCQARVCGPFWWCFHKALQRRFVPVGTAHKRSSVPPSAVKKWPLPSAGAQKRPCTSLQRIIPGFCHPQALHQPALEPGHLLPGLTRPNWRRRLISAATSMQCFECQLTDAISSAFRTNKVHWVLLCWYLQGKTTNNRMLRAAPTRMRLPAADNCRRRRLQPRHRHLARKALAVAEEHVVRRFRRRRSSWLTAWLRRRGRLKGFQSENRRPLAAAVQLGVPGRLLAGACRLGRCSLVLPGSNEAGGCFANTSTWERTQATFLRVCEPETMPRPAVTRPLQLPPRKCGKETYRKGLRCAHLRGGRPCARRRGLCPQTGGRHRRGTRSAGTHICCCAAGCLHEEAKP